MIILYFWIGINSTGSIKLKSCTIKEIKHPKIGIAECIFGDKASKKIIDVCQINMEKVTFWCNSLNVLWWIKGMSQKFKPFIANFVEEIQSLTEPLQWRYE